MTTCPLNEGDPVRISDPDSKHYDTYGTITSTSPTHREILLDTGGRCAFTPAQLSSVAEETDYGDTFSPGADPEPRLRLGQYCTTWDGHLHRVRERRWCSLFSYGWMYGISGADSTAIVDELDEHELTPAYPQRHTDSEATATNDTTDTAPELALYVASQKEPIRVRCSQASIDNAVRRHLDGEHVIVHSTTGERIAVRTDNLMALHSTPSK